jgi:hypothetical protein
LAIHYNRISSKHHTLGLDIRQKIIEIAKFNQQFAEETLSLARSGVAPEMTPATIAVQTNGNHMRHEPRVIHS